MPGSGCGLSERSVSLSITALSADSIADAIRSLALFYGMPQSKIEDVYEKSWPEFLPPDTTCEVFKDEWLTWCLGQYLNSQTMSRNLPVCFYHRARFDGCSHWFDDGLLSNQQGAQAFFKKIKTNPIWPSILDGAADIALSNIRDRDNLSNMHGPHAFDLLPLARFANTAGLDYDLPECLEGPVWDHYREIKTELLRFCQENLKPVVVKFVGTPESMDRYINHLWLYLHMERFGIDLCDTRIYSFNGRGQNVPRDAIVDLIEIR